MPHSQSSILIAYSSSHTFTTSSMADITDPAGLEHGSPGDDLAGNGNDSRGTKRPRASMAGEDDDDDDEKGGRERRKIEIKFIQDKSRRHITFSKRKAGIMKKVGSIYPF
jgi:pheromone receptor transcription factor